MFHGKLMNRRTRSYGRQCPQDYKTFPINQVVETLIRAYRIDPILFEKQTTDKSCPNPFFQKATQITKPVLYHKQRNEELENGGERESPAYTSQYTLQSILLFIVDIQYHKSSHPVHNIHLTSFPRIYKSLFFERKLFKRKTMGTQA